MQYLDKLRALKDRSGMTYQQISDATGIPTATVNRLFGGTTQNPSFDDVVSVIRALGGSVDELVGIRSPENPATPAMAERAIAAYDKLAAEKDARIRDKDAALKEANRSRTVVLIALIGLLVVLVAVLLFDVLNGNVGFVRY